MKIYTDQKGRYVTKDGRTVPQVAEEIGISTSAVYARLKRGKESLDDIARTGRKGPNCSPGRPPKHTTKDGKTVPQVAEETGLSNSTVYHRIGKGESLDEILESGKKVGRDEEEEDLITLNGKSQTIAKWAKEIGISISGLRYRLTNHRKEIALTRAKGDL